MNWFLDVFSLDESDHQATLVAIDRLQRETDGPCEDDVEACAPFVSLLPEETPHEQPSPLNFGRSPGDDVCAPPRRLISLPITYDEAT